MSLVPDGLKYTKDHIWARIEGDVATIGITDYAQRELGIIANVELPMPVGSVIGPHATFGIIQSVKTVSELFFPVSGMVSEVNNALPADPSVINQDPYGKGWMIKVKMDSGRTEDFLDAAAYKAMF